jgi:cytidylate kinase
MINSAENQQIIAISGKSGCGNTTVSRLLAERLGYSLVNYTFRNLAAERGVGLPEIIALAEEDFTYDRLVDARQVELARKGRCVIGSRLAIWMLPDAVLRVYLTAGIHARVERIMAREGGEESSVRAFTEDRDEKDRQRYRRIYGIDNNDFSFADLVVNTERFSPDSIVDILVAAIATKREDVQ